MHDEMMKKPDMSEICQIEKDLTSTLKTVVSHGVLSKEVDAKELGELVDMVKDMAEVKRNCWEAHYYKTVSEAMEEYDDPDNVMGYNRNRYSSGRYAPSGTGDRTYGYTPYYHMMPYMKRNMPSYEFDTDSMGYSEGRNGRESNGRMMNGNGQNNSYGYPYDHDGRGNQYGMAFKEYEDARKHYTETKSLEDRSHMDKKAMEHVNQSMMTLREIWKDADPTVKKEVSSAVATLASEFKTA